ncbi:MAG: beta/alpha barrel domain-containing protein [Patescibacteria group bacterium]
MVIPAILTNRKSELLEEISIVENLSEKVHIDIMDGTLTKETTLPLKEIPDIEGIKVELHLMVKTPSLYKEDILRLKPEVIIIHVEIPDFENEVEKLRGDWKIFAGIDLNTNISDQQKYTSVVDGFLIMAVEIGRSGQSFNREVLNKVAFLKKELVKTVEIDGGVNKDNIKTIMDSGASYAVSHSSIYKTQNIEDAIFTLNSIS